MTRIVIPQRRWPGELLNINSMRVHHHRAAAMVKPWRTLGWALAKEQHLQPLQPPVEVWARFRFPTNHRRDTGNLYPTVKALIDGIVSAGVLEDDCDGLLRGPWLVREYPNGDELITLEMKAE